jgi:hypothetical protein
MHGVPNPGCPFISRGPWTLAVSWLTDNQIIYFSSHKNSPPDRAEGYLDHPQLLVMAQRPSRLLGLPETRSFIFLIKISPDQVEGYLDYLQPCTVAVGIGVHV